jgi:hypothetical protein
MTRVSVTTSKASLVGGVVVGIAAFVLSVAVLHELSVTGPPAWVAGAVVAVILGVWTRIADL